MKNIKDNENLNQKKVLLRLDLNVPLKNGVITDQTRINKIIPTIEFLLNKNSQIIIISHVGRPKGKINKDLSLKPICENLEKKINRKIKIIDSDIFNLKQEDLFKDPNDPKQNTKLMKYLDQMNSYETQIYYASQNTKKWSPMKQNMTSPKYTTNWFELPNVN